MDSLISDILCSLLLLECCFLSVFFILNPILLFFFCCFFFLVKRTRALGLSFIPLTKGAYASSTLWELSSETMEITLITVYFRSRHGLLYWRLLVSPFFFIPVCQSMNCFLSFHNGMNNHAINSFSTFLLNYFVYVLVYMKFQIFMKMNIWKGL